MRRPILLVPLFAIASFNSQAQSSIAPSTLNATGGTHIIGGNEFDWSVGEMTMVSTLTGSSIVVTQGVLQPDDQLLGVVTTAIPTDLKVFPNPASSVVNVQYTSAVPVTLTCRLMDMLGHAISTTTIDVNQGTTTQQVNISSLACATYMLEVSINSGANPAQNAVYKIQKLQ